MKSLDEVELHLKNKRPVVVGIQVYRNFDEAGRNFDEPILEPPAADMQMLGVQAVVIVARSERGFKIANSWGTGWGHKGFYEVSMNGARALILLNAMWAVEVERCTEKLSGAC